ncbi:hypothetical protein CLL_A2142 [Clostridium botulinum B str. Eklund 17B (NRP)]|uniref:Uncharacterized protein n=1 Tax=Clostridium botulinum (strain Eklund 17B / Type B) TaxID=935198 RepID=B2TLP9_CLOBB|nr:hypothetical protein CLL_A2142 [Clostridium botulinum B str. Eklund 17B (NRP)]MBY7002093.1 hypothetical protein [Clostridium botulinum]MCR1272849.1 hypothetical protein [Clostridium botulinum]
MNNVKSGQKNKKGDLNYKETMIMKFGEIKVELKDGTYRDEIIMGKIIK